MKSMEISEEVRQACIHFFQECGESQEIFCDKMDISRSAWLRIVNKTATSSRKMTSKTWKKLYPHIRKHLPNDYSIPFHLEIVEKQSPNDPLTQDMLVEWRKLERGDKLEILKLINILEEEKKESFFASGT